MRTPFVFTFAAVIVSCGGGSQPAARPAGPPPHIVPMSEIGAGPTPLSPAPPDGSERQRAVSLAMSPLATRIVPAKHAGDAARVIAMTLLTCRGRVTAVPGHDLVAVTDVAEVLDHASEIVQTLDATPPKPLK